MNYIEQLILEKEKNDLTIDLAYCENYIAQKITHDIKKEIKNAIENKKNNILGGYYWDSDGYLTIDMYIKSIHDYLNSASGLSTLALCLEKPPRTNSKNFEDWQVINMLRGKDKDINLSNIEKLISEEIYKLGAKNINIGLQYVENYIKQIEKKKLFRTHVEEHTITVNRYKIYFEVSW